MMILLTILGALIILFSVTAVLALRIERKARKRTNWIDWDKFDDQ